MTTERISQTTDREIVISRVLNAPRELVWEMWTRPEHIAKWWGPHGFTTTTHEMNAEENGTWRFIMHGPNNMDFPSTIKYTKVIKPEKLCYDQGSEDPTHPVLFETSVHFEDVKGKTRLTMRMLFPTAEDRNKVVKEYGAIEGQKQTIGRLEDYLSEASKSDELVIVREFNAPLAMVYRALSEAEALAKWWGPKGANIQVDKFDFSEGGIFLYNMAMGEMVMWGLFRYLEIEAPERIVFLSSFSDKDANVLPAGFIPDFPLEIMNIIKLSEKDGKTVLTLSGSPAGATAAQQQAYRNMLPGMQQGFAGTFDQLDDYLKGQS